MKQFFCYEEPEEVCQKNDLTTLVRPFWMGNVMYNESVCFINIGGHIRGRLLFKPERIVGLRSNDLKTEFVEGKDWRWDEFTQTLELIPGSCIPYFEPSDLRGDGLVPVPGNPNGFDELKRAQIGQCLYCEGPFFWEKALNVTYVYDPKEWKGYNESYKPALLPGTIKRLTEKEHIKFVVYGDSSHTGADTSSWYNREPFMPSYPELVRLELQRLYGAKITLVNNAVGGTASTWGVDNFKEKVLDEKPDLLLLGFGNNDCGAGFSIKDIIGRLEYMIDTVREKCPGCEVILMGPILANHSSGHITYSPDLVAPQKNLEREGVAYCDIFKCFSDIAACKDYAAICGNGVTHPNDWTTRVYSANTLALLVDYDKNGY